MKYCRRIMSETSQKYKPTQQGVDTSLAHSAFEIRTYRNQPYLCQWIAGIETD